MWRREVDHELSFQNERAMAGAAASAGWRAMIAGRRSTGSGCLRRRIAGVRGRRRMARLRCRCGEQPAAQRELGGAMAVGEEAVVADAMEAVGQGVQQEAADELVGVERHDLGLAAWR